MKKFYVLAGAAIIGVAAYASQAKGNEEKKPLETISAKPITVKTSEGPRISVIVEVEGKYVLCRKYKGGNTSYQGVADAAAIIQSEINDGDTEPVELTGRYDGKYFYINSVKANGLEAKLRNK